ncbi:MAG: hypothetical protein ACREOC_03340 [Gemmatimonadales bacterium]
MRYPKAPGASRLQAVYSELQSLANVRGCYIGCKRRKGRNTRRLALVCCVEAKLPARRLARAHRVPDHVEWPITSTRSGTLPTDVQAVGHHGFQSAPLVLGPGDLITPLGIGQVPTANRGTAGVAMNHPLFGSVVTTAAHVLGVSAAGAVTFPVGSEPAVQVTLVGRSATAIVPGSVRRAVVAENADYAIVSASGAIENLYLDDAPLGAPHILTSDDIGSSCFVLSARGLIPTTVRGVRGALQIGPLFLRDLVLTDMCTVAGDSGAALVDQDSRIVGLLEGVCELEGRRHSVFCSAVWPFIDERGAFL